MNTICWLLLQGSTSCFCSLASHFYIFLDRKLRQTWDSHTTYDIKIILFKLSTGKPHPAAKESTIHVLSSHWDNPAIGVEIVGDRLVLILTYPDNPWRPDDRVFVYDWRNGVQKMVGLFIHSIR
jgi:hypothetical protein